MLKVYYWLVIAGLVAYCFNSRVTVAQRLVYRVDLQHASDRYITVTVQPIEIRPDTMIFQMPVWTPGIYSEVHYGRFIRDFTAVDTNGRELSVKQMSPDRWKIAGASNIREIRYRVEDSREDGTSPTIGLASIDGNAVFANTEAIFGYVDNDKGIPATIIFTVPKDWSIATSLEPATDNDLTLDARLHQLVYNVDGYEDLSEAPLLASANLSATSFTQSGVDYYIVSASAGVSDKKLSVDSFAAVASKVVQAETSFFRQVPYDEYWFVIYDEPGAGPSAGSFSMGDGLAHSASSIYTVHGGDWPIESVNIQHLIAATFFKTWNGKRFHISPLGPVDFQAPCEARSLWFTEGVSDYYADVLMVRYGLISPAEFFNRIDGLESATLATLDVGSGQPISLEELSAKENHYDRSRCDVMRRRGALTALMLDIEIRSKTHNRRSLDNVLARMNADVPSGKTYDDKLLIKTISKYASIDLDTFYTHYIAGKDALPIEAYLAMMGAGREVPQSMQVGGPMGLELALNAAGTAIIDAVPADTFVETRIVDDAHLADSGPELKKGDTVAAIDGAPVTLVAVAALKSQILQGQVVKLKVVRNNKPVEVTVKSKTKPRHVPLATLRKASGEQLALRKSLLGRRRVIRVKHA